VFFILLIIVWIRIKPPEPPKPQNVWTESITGMEFVLVEGGSFDMGCDKNLYEHCQNDEEKKTEMVSSFWMGKYEVTHKQWNIIMNGDNVAYSDNSDLPVNLSSLENIKKFIEKLNNKSGCRFKLPNQKQWEYACRSKGQDELYSGGNNPELVAVYAAIDSNDNTLHTVGSKASNKLGLFDMSGNVWEWCQDDGDMYIRGGSWKTDVENVRCTFRIAFPANISYTDIGFRLIREHDCTPDME